MNKKLHDRLVEFEDIIEHETVKLSKEANKRLLDPDDWPNDYEIYVKICVYFPLGDDEYAEFILDGNNANGLWRKPGELIDKKWPGHYSDRSDEFYTGRWYHGVNDNRNHKDIMLIEELQEEFHCCLYRELEMFLPDAEDKYVADKICEYKKGMDISIEGITPENICLDVGIEYQLLNIEEED